MNFPRKARFWALAALMVMLVGGLAVSSAEAGCGYGHGLGYGLGYGHVHTTYVPTTYIAKPYVFPVHHNCHFPIYW